MTVNFIINFTMNVKKVCLGNSLKVNNVQLRSLAVNDNQSKLKGKIGQEIRKKTKINNMVENSYLKEEKQNVGNQNFLRVQNNYEQKHSSFGLKNLDRNTYRTDLMKRSVDVQSRRSSKSVRFSDTFKENTLKRKSSTSSILKNGSSSLKKSFISEKNSMNNSICSNICKEDQSNQNVMLNKALKEKYQRIARQLEQNNKKYSDELYPPLWSSLSRTSRPQFNEIKWKRLSEIFFGKEVKVWEPNSDLKICPGKYSKNNMISNCLNSIKSNNFLLQKMFQTQKYNPNGLYYVKIHQNNVWKYVIVDDYIPVRVNKNSKHEESAFLTLLSSHNDKVEIWPFLLQKAYAKSYSTYQCLSKGHELDFLQQLTGCPIQQIPVFPDQMPKIMEEMQNLDSILMGKTKNGYFHPFIPRKNQITYQNSLNNYSQHILPTTSTFIDNFDSVFCVCLHKFYYRGSCTIKHSHKKDNLDYISLRTIKVQEHTDCIFNVCQKDLRYYNDQYRYAWIRIIVAMKEGPQNYRWVVGNYGNTKNTIVRCNLEPGQYYIFLMPEWKENKGFDYNLQVHANTSCIFERKPYKGNENVLVEAAMDLAQSYGVLKQLNKNICTYSYIERRVGFIIESINNERPNGPIRVLRSIEGLQKPGKKLVEALNKEFREDPTIEIKINSLDHFTVVLAVIGGIDQNFLNKFDFGS